MIDVASLKAKVTKCDEDSQHAKKGLKAETWVNRGKAYFKLVTAPTDMLHTGMSEAELVVCGKAGAKADVTVAGKTFNTIKYPYFTIYMSDGKTAAWKVTKSINPKALDEALKSYAKAIEIDPNAKGVVDAEYMKITDYYKMIGQNANTIGDLLGGANAFMSVNRIQKIMGKEAIDPMVLFYAGYMYTISGAENAASYPKGENALKAALAAGYNAVEDANSSMADSSRGSIYYYLFHCAFGQSESKPEKLKEAKKYLITGLEKYPKNKNIFEGLLQLYTTNSEMGNPADLLPIIDKLLAENPEDVDAWSARGRVYVSMKNNEESIASYAKVLDINPKSYEANYLLGQLYISEADAMSDKYNATTYTDYSKAELDKKAMDAVYLKAVPYLEAAYEARNSDVATLEILKKLCFRLRNEPGMAEKSSKYTALYNAL